MSLLDVAKIAKTAALVGAGLPAYKELFDQVVDAFQDRPADQQQLKDAYAAAMRDAEAAHEDAQRL